jgi:hypothetical protein
MTTYRRPFVLSTIVALVILGPAAGTPHRIPAVGRSRGPSPAPASRSPGPSANGLIQEIARDAVVGPPGSEPDTAVEPFVAADPTHPDVVVAVFQMSRFPDGGAAAIGFAASHDRGATWTSGVLPGLTRASGGVFVRASDPSVTFGPDGAVYASSIVLRGPRGEGIAVNRSDDAGITWTSPVLLQHDPPRSGDDFPRIAADVGARSIYAGRIYVTFVRHDHVVLRWSDDRAGTWSQMAAVSAGKGFVPNLMVGPDGAITILYITEPPNKRPMLVSRTSRDGGASFGPPVELGAMRPHVRKDWRAGGVQESTVDPVTGTLYAVWENARADAERLNDVVLVRSVDGGTSWSSPRRVTAMDSKSGQDHLMPSVAARGKRVDIIYFSRAITNRGPSRFVQLRSMSSSDGGGTFGAGRAIGGPADLRFAAAVRPGQTRFLGDYMGMALTTTSSFVVWCRSSPPGGADGFHTTVWAAATPEAAAQVLRP